MSSLYPRYKHSRLNTAPWSTEFAKAGISRIVEDADRSYRERDSWQTHPLDGDRLYGTGPYLGSIGMFWGLEYLQAAGFSSEAAEKDSEEFYTEILRLNERDSTELPPDLEGDRAYLFGPTLLHLLRYLRAPNARLSAELYERLSNGVDQPVLELMWGLAGEMIATYHLHTLTGELRYQELLVEQAKRLLESADPSQKELRFTIQLYGETHQGIGAVHGFAGNAVALLKAAPHMPEKGKSELYERITQTLLKSALCEEGYVNWPRAFDSGWWQKHDCACRLYHCHGAPGILTSMAGLPVGYAEELEVLFVQAGELIYRAGPLRKGANLCHGTAGNGLALLHLFKRTQDQLWLDRAREFAMHSLSQVDSARSLFSQGRYTLWTGDVGTALFVLSAIEEDPFFPTIDRIRRL